jgi:hypothetical protein
LLEGVLGCFLAWLCEKNTVTAKNISIHFQLVQQNGTGLFFLCNEKKEIFFSSQLKNYGLCSIEKS